MKARTTVIVIAVVAALSLVTLGGVALANSGIGPAGWTGWMHPSASSTTQGTPGVYCPMARGNNGSGGYYGPGGMMGGYRGAPAAQATPAIGVTHVSIQDYAFQPAVIQVNKGTTVTWTNQDSVAHMVTFGNGMRGSGVLQRGQSFSYTFATPGTYAYFCGAHPYMTGTVIVTA